MTDRRTFIKQLGALGILTMIPATLTTPKIAEFKINLELMQDLNSFHGIDGEKEIASMISNEIGQEIDVETLMKKWEEAVVEVNPNSFQPYKTLRFEV